MTPWFTNRGQILATAFSAVSACIAVLVWAAIRPNDVLYVVPFIVGFCVVWASVQFGRWLGAPEKRGDDLPAPPIAKPTAPPATMDDTIRMLDRMNPNPPPPPPIFLLRADCRVGGIWEGTIYDRSLKIIVHSIRKIKNTTEYEADVEMTAGTGVVEGGEETTRISGARFWVPRSSHGYKSEPNMLYNLEISPPYHVRIFSLRVEHINVPGQEVRIEICIIAGRPQLLGGLWTNKL